MEEKQKSPYSSIIGNYIPICKGMIVFNHSGDHSVYYSMIFVICVFIVIIVQILAPLIVLVAFNSTELMYVVLYNILYRNDTHWFFYVVLIILNLGCELFLYNNIELYISCVEHG